MPMVRRAERRVVVEIEELNKLSLEEATKLHEMLDSWIRANSRVFVDEDGKIVFEYISINRKVDFGGSDLKSISETALGAANEFRQVIQYYLIHKRFSAISKAGSPALVDEVFRKNGVDVIA